MWNTLKFLNNGHQLAIFNYYPLWEGVRYWEVAKLICICPLSGGVRQVEVSVKGIIFFLVFSQSIVNRCVTCLSKWNLLKMCRNNENQKKMTLFFLHFHFSSSIFIFIFISFFISFFFRLVRTGWPRQTRVLASPISTLGDISWGVPSAAYLVAARKKTERRTDVPVLFCLDYLVRKVGGGLWSICAAD